MTDRERPATEPDGTLYHRHWDHYTRWGYVAAGGGSRYSDALKRLSPGDVIVAYQRGAGYVGYGVVTGEATPMHTFRLADGRILEDALKLTGRNAGRPEEQWEYALSIDWKKVVPLEEAKTFKGVFANQNVVCRLSDPQTASFLRREFDIATSVSNPA